MGFNGKSHQRNAAPSIFQIVENDAVDALHNASLNFSDFPLNFYGTGFGASPQQHLQDREYQTRIQFKHRVAVKG